MASICDIRQVIAILLHVLADLRQAIMVFPTFWSIAHHLLLLLPLLHLGAGEDQAEEDGQQEQAGTRLHGCHAPSHAYTTAYQRFYTGSFKGQSCQLIFPLLN